MEGVVVRQVRRVVSVAVSAIAIGTGGACASSGGQSSSNSLAASAGPPEVTIPGVDRKQVVSELTSYMLANKYRVAKMEDYTAQFEQDGSTMMGLLGGTRADPHSVYRVTYTMVDVPAGGVRVIADAALIGSPGGASEKRYDMNSGRPGANMRSYLRSLREKLAPGAP
jgi:hypothetical protein